MPIRVKLIINNVKQRFLRIICTNVSEMPENILHLPIHIGVGFWSNQRVEYLGKIENELTFES